jgi:hypothetical protein
VKLIVPTSTYRVFGPGEICTDAVAGDLVLVAHDSLAAKVIRTVERARVPGEFCWTNHACIVVFGGPNAIVSQEAARGDILTPLANLAAVTFAVVHVECTDEQRAAGVLFAQEAVHFGYGWAQIPADGFNAVTGLELGIGIGDRMVCSTQSARALERMGLIPDRSPAAVLPAHLCLYFGVRLERSAA